MIGLPDIIRAQQRIKPYLHPTPMEYAPGLGESVWLKLECANRTHSFKIRGALNAVLSLDEAARERGIIAASSGNHAQAVAYAAQLVGASAQICMPSHTPKRKVNGVLRHGGEPLLDKPNYDEAELQAREIEKRDGKTFVSPYNDEMVVAGAGTIGLEILETMPDVERVVVCVSGGGLIAGIATAVKSMQPDVEVIGVNAETAPAMYNLFYNTELPHNWDTLAEALSGDIEEGSVTVPLTRKYVDQIALVSEEQIAGAMRWMIEQQGWLVEGGGAVGVAALLNNIIPNDKRTAVVVSGGNVDAETVKAILCG